MEKKVLENILNINKLNHAKLTGEGREITLELNGKKLTGFAACVLFIYSLKEGNVLNDCAYVHHWLSYCSRDLFHCANHQELHQCLKYINTELLSKTYLCGCEESIADIVLFISLEPFISEWTYQTKEQYVNISRWFSTLQVSKSLEKLKWRPVNFSRTLLYNERSIS